VRVRDFFLSDTNLTGFILTVREPYFDVFAVFGLYLVVLGRI